MGHKWQILPCKPSLGKSSEGTPGTNPLLMAHSMMLKTKGLKWTLPTYKWTNAVFALSQNCKLDISIWPQETKIGLLAYNNCNLLLKCNYKGSWQCDWLNETIYDKNSDLIILNEITYNSIQFDFSILWCCLSGISS
jgi:hypothetical protein